MIYHLTPRFFLCVMLALSFACTEGGLEPARDSIAIDLRPVFATTAAATESLPINRIRLTVRDAATRAVLLSRPQDVSPDAAPWQIEIEIPVRTPDVRVIVTVELINVTGGVETVEWSGLVGPIELAPGARPGPQTVHVHPGPLDNLSVTGIALHDAPETMLEGDVARLRAAVDAPAGTNVRVVWSTSDAAVLAVDQSGNVTALLPGSARITAAAGPQQAVADITVRGRPSAVVIEPGSALIDQLGASITFSAAAVDARGNPLAGTIAWSTDAPGVLEHDGAGRFTAVANGTATVTAALAGQPALAGTATVVVAQRAAMVTVDPGDVTIGARGATVQLTAHARDAGGTAIADVAFQWQSSNPAVAAVSATGLVTGGDEGTATISALTDGAVGTAQVTVRTVARMEVHAGDGQTARVATALPVLPAVRVTNAAGAPVSGVVVTFAVTHGGGMIENGTGVTDAAGIAQAGVWTLGTTAGQNTLTASAAGAGDVTFTATGTADVAANIAIAAGDGQTARVATTLPTAPTVRVTDRFGNPVSGATVVFTADRDATVVPSSAVTDADGLASATWTLGPAAGTYTVRAAVDGVGAVTFTATAQTAEPAAISIVAGDGQTAPVGDIVPQPPVVRVTDAAGNPVAGVVVTFEAHGGDSRIEPGSPITSVHGIATAGPWTLGSTPGTYTVTASIDGADGVISVTFTAEATSGSASLSGTVVSATSSHAVAGAVITLSSASGHVRQATTGSAGEYAFSDLAPGEYTVRITAEGFGDFTGTIELVDGEETTRTFAILPVISGDAIRIVLTWNETPYDLDSHLDVPAYEGQGPFHVAYYARGSADVYPFAVLDTDQTGGYGPETITITQQLPGTYTYSVFNYSGTPELRTSGATVEVYRGNARVATFAVPDQPGRTWTVFSLVDGVLTPINQLDGGTSQDQYPAPDAMGIGK